MKPFKFLTRINIQYIPIITKDTEITHHIPVELYENILHLAVDLHINNMRLYGPLEFNLTGGNGEQITYQYAIDKITPFWTDSDTILIEYSIKFPGAEQYSDFLTHERISLYETL